MASPAPSSSRSWSSRSAHLVAMALDHPRVSAGLQRFRAWYDIAPIRDTGLNNALKMTDEEIAKLSPIRLPVVHKRLDDIAYGANELPALVFFGFNPSA